ncbi:MAG: precorrin-6y C5,15-methyltransferase (decarboxylating) subunit CbiE [Chloroflexi bacterium]|nr:precorrin-6y C5,15-methyltransferase (decarboxylating) subunit CbiE [Chloroflexota bacterium]
MAVHIVGVGADGRYSLSQAALEMVERAELLVGGKRLLAMFPESQAERLVLASDTAATVEELRGALGRRRIVVLASGDPDFFGIARLLVERLGKDRVEILPNVSSVQLAFARIKESWDDATFLSVHGRGPEALAAISIGLRRSRKLAILTDNVNTPAVVAQHLLQGGVRSCRAYLCEDLAGPNERVREASLDALAGVEAAPLSILVLIRDGDPPKSPRVRGDSGGWPHGIPESEFLHRGGVITKAEVRLAALARLRLRESSVIWDVGAGCGSVAIEAAMIARLGQVYAVERDAENVEMIRANLARFGLENLTVVHGEAPAVLEGLPAPDAVFIGGSGGKLRSILHVVDRRLAPEGTVVVNAASLETAGLASAALRERGYTVEATLMQVSRSKDLAGLTHFEALDPVFIVTGRKAT